MARLILSDAEPGVGSLNWTPVVDGGECGAYALGQLTGPGILTRHHVPARAPALNPAPSTQSVDVVAARIAFDFSVERRYRRRRHDETEPAADAHSGRIVVRGGAGLCDWRSHHFR